MRRSSSAACREMARLHWGKSLAKRRMAGTWPAVETEMWRCPRPIISGSAMVCMASATDS